MQLHTVEINNETYIKVDNINNDEININGEVYKKYHSSNNRNRHLVVMDKGFIWAGDLSHSKSQFGATQIELERPVMLARWSDIWLSGAIENPKSDNVKIVQNAGSPGVQNKIIAPAFSEIFRTPVNDNWGLE